MNTLQLLKPVKCLLIAPLALWVCFAVPALASAQVRIGPDGPQTVQPKDKPDKKKPAPARRNQLEPFRFTVTPRAVPDLPLQYTLLPKAEDRKSGNSVPFYYRALMSLKESFPRKMQQLKEREGITEREFWRTRYESWTDRPLKTFPKDDVREFLTAFNFEDLRIAAHRKTTDWSWRLDRLKGYEVIGFLLPEIQEARNMARLLVLKIRLEIAEGRYDDAVKSLQMGFQLARDVAEPPTLINDLVGLAISSVLLSEVRELINRPDAPNLYWALSALPQPFIDMRPAMEYEMQLPAKVFPVIKNPEDADHSPQEWSRLLSKGLLEFHRFEEGGFPRQVDSEMLVRLMVTGLALRGYPRAKRDLVEWGYDRVRVERMPVGQVIAIHQARVYRKTAQEMLKWSYLPYHEAGKRLETTEQRLKREGYLSRGMQGREIIPLTSLLMPAVTQARRAGVRADARIASLRVVEAIRLYAATHNRRLPEQLSDITAVPVPDNPLTGKPFEYRVQGDTAVLDVTDADYMPFPPDWRRLEITIRK